MSAEGRGPRRARFGYISHSTINVGDDIQSVAAKRLLPQSAAAVDREFIAEFSSPLPVNVLVNGWFMHQAGSYWDLPVPPPRASWPPAPRLAPLFISLHLTQTFHDTVFSAANVDYLRAHAPIGARDLFTLDALRQHDVRSYFSGCLTLTLAAAPLPRRRVIYLVDVDDPSFEYIRRRTDVPLARLSHGRAVLPLLRPAHRLRYAEYLLGLYARAHCVVTTRLHAALPCLAFETPVLMLSSQTKGWPNARFDGLLEHLNHGSVDELISGELDYDLNDPPANPQTHLQLRADLSNAIARWVARVEDGARV